MRSGEEVGVGLRTWLQDIEETGGSRWALGTGPWGGAMIPTDGSVSAKFPVLWDRGGRNRVQAMKSERG